MTSGNFEAKISIDIHIQQWLRMDHTPGIGNWTTMITERSIWTHYGGLVTFADFITFWYVISKKRKKSGLFWHLKETLNTYSRTLAVARYNGPCRRTARFISASWATACAHKRDRLIRRRYRFLLGHWSCRFRHGATACRETDGTTTIV